MLIDHNLALATSYQLNPRGESSLVFLRLLKEPYDRDQLHATREAARDIEALAQALAWKETLWQWPSQKPEIFGRVTFFRMFCSSTQRGLDAKSGATTEDGIKTVKEKWIRAMLRVQEHIDNSEMPTFERIQSLNAILGHKPRTVNLHERFACFDAADLPEAAAQFDAWFAELRRNNVWPIQMATLVASYLVAVHPFENGNGRTARLVLDWILGLYNLPPVSFANRLQALLSRATGEWDVPHHVALAKVSQGIHNTLKLIQGLDILESIETS